MKLRKVILIAAAVLLCGCTQKPKEATPVSVLVPQGAPALAALELFDQEAVTVTTVSGSDPLSAELAKNDSGYDIVIAPLNLGAKLIEKGNTPFRLAAIITWGNLYIVGEDSYQNGEAFAAFGETAVPGKILTHYADVENVTYFNSVQDVQAQLLSGKVKAGLLAEPAVTATIAKAKEKGKAFTVLKDLQEASSEDGQKGYPQAAIFVKSGSEDAAQETLDTISAFLAKGTSDEERIKALIEKAGTDNLGIPSAETAIASWERQNLKYVNADEVQNDIAAFLELFNITFDAGMLME